MAWARPDLKLSTIWMIVAVTIICSISLNYIVMGDAKQPSSTSLRIIAKVNNFNAAHLAFSPDSKMLANGTDGKIEIWDTQRWKLLSTLRDPRLRSPFSFSTDGKTMTIRVTNNQVQVWDVKRAKVIKTLAGYRAHLTFSSDGRLMAGWSMNKGEVEEGTKIWDSRNGRRLHVLNNNTTDSDQHVFSRDNKTLIIVNVDNFVKIYDVKSGKIISDTDISGNIVPPIVLSLDGKVFASIEEGNLVGDEPIPGSDVRSATDSGLPVSYSARLWSARTGKLIRSFGYWESRDKSTAPVGFTSDSKRVFFNVGERTGYSGRSYALCFDVATGNELQTFSIENPVLMSPDRKLLVYGKKDLKVWAVD